MQSAKCRNCVANYIFPKLVPSRCFSMILIKKQFNKLGVCRTLLGYPPQSLRDSSPSRVEPKIAFPLRGEGGTSKASDGRGQRTRQIQICKTKQQWRKPLSHLSVTAPLSGKPRDSAISFYSNVTWILLSVDVTRILLITVPRLSIIRVETLSSILRRITFLKSRAPRTLPSIFETIADGVLSS